ncbi:MAG TPA: hypothetical protein VGX25_32465 [Actinophytocola sp.]|uniref:hypothetical protein n=1 Tax=Actinophytocola sp. TaxID=1872138 RepID=UPI002DDCD857|nr:hypothetical protein [Actinophytocola sp.]HEV2784125.1 hypothetical protein [Actinophytocola sp.]
MYNGLRATGAGTRGTIRLLGGPITGSQLMAEAELANESGPALFADGLHVDGNMFLRNGFRATGTGDSGTLRLLGARIGGDFDMPDAVIERGPGLVVYLERAGVGAGSSFPPL